MLRLTLNPHSVATGLGFVIVEFLNLLLQLGTYIYTCIVKHTGDAIRVMYSSVSVGVVHVLCACAQVQSTV